MCIQAKRKRCPSSRQMRAVIAANACALIGVSTIHASQKYAVTDLGTLGGSVSHASAINAAGQIVGVSDRAFLYSDGKMIDLATLYSNSNLALSRPEGINDSGQLVGTYSTSSFMHAFSFSNGTFNDLTPGIPFGDEAEGVNDSGQVTGYTYVGLNERAFIYSGGTLNVLGTLGGTDSKARAINASGDVVGEASTGVQGSSDHAFLYSAGKMNDLGSLGGSVSIAFAVNASDQVVGGSLLPGDSVVDAFLYSGGHMTDIGSLGSPASQAGAYGINDSGQVVGATDSYAFIYDGGAMSDLNSLLPSNSGWNLQTARAINNRGEIVGDGVNASGQTHAFLLTPLSTSWSQIAGGSWGSASNWSGGIPGGAGASIGFLSGPGLTAPGVISLNGNRAVGRITFDNASGYTIATGSSGTLTIDDAGDVGGASPLIRINNGNQKITAPIAVANGVTIVSASNSSLNIAGGVSGSGALISSGSGLLTVSGSGTIGVPLVVNGNVNFASNTGSGILPRNVFSLSIGSGGILSIADPGPGNHANRSVLVTGGLAFAGSPDHWQGQFDLTSNDLIVHNGDMAALSNQIKMGFNAQSGNWNGPGGIISTTAASDKDSLTAIGYRAGGNPFDGLATTNTDVLVKYALYGDADLDGVIDGADYQQIDLGFGMHLTGWENGDFNYDGIVDASDYALIDNTFNQTSAANAASLSLDAGSPALIVSQNVSAVPEPAALGVMVLAALYVYGKRQWQRRLSRNNFY